MSRIIKQLNILDDQFLVDRLKSASATDLEVLWDALLDGGRVATGAAVREMFETAAKRKIITEGALQVFVAELQHYGGNAVVNLARRTGVPYLEILKDTLDYLNGTSNEGIREIPELSTLRDSHFFDGNGSTRDHEVCVLERSIIVQQAKLLWDNSDNKLRGEMALCVGSPPVRTAALDALNDPEILLRFTRFLCGKEYDHEILHINDRRISGTLGGYLFGPHGAILGSIAPQKLRGKIASVISSHRVTLPCINQLIRIRLCEEKSNSSQVTDRKQPSSFNNVIALPSKGHPLVIENDAGSKLLSTIDLAIDALPPNAMRLDVEKSGINRLSSLFQVMPTAVIADEASSARYMKVIVEGPLTLAKDGNGFRGFVQGSDGRITEHVRLFDGDISQVANAAALINVASFALGQKHMTDISERLNVIKDGVERISTFQQRGRQSEIMGAIAYMKLVAESVLAGSNREAVENLLESEEAKLLAIQIHLESDIKEVIDKILNGKD